MDENGKRVFDRLEYAVFFGLLGVSATIGIWVAVKQRTATVEEYMLGGKRMPLLPVALSLAARSLNMRGCHNFVLLFSSFVSGITLLGIPAETYMFGTQLYNICIAIGTCYFFMSFFYLPVIYNLQVNSLFEYLEMRFDKSVRTLASLVYALSVLLIVPVVIYVPALAFNQVTGMPLYVLAPIICGICIFYTSLGGLKAVVWSDALQTGCVLLALAAVIVIGVSRVGGVSELIRINQEGERLEMFNLDPNPTARNTFWTTTLGSIPTWLQAFAANPSSAQRYISLRTYGQAKMSVLFMVLGIVTLKSLSTLTGLIIYARYHSCDPVLTKEVEKDGQLLPHFTMEVAETYPGLAGLFMAGVVCTALSTMSTMLNTIAGTLYEDLLKSRLPWKETDVSAQRTMKLITLLLGAITTAMVFLVDRLGTIMQVAVSMLGICTGVLLFMFTFGMFFPWGNSRGVKAGTVGGLLSTLFLVGGTQYYTQTGGIRFGTKLRSLAGCSLNMSNPIEVNSTLLGYSGEGTRVFFSDSVPWVFRLSYLYYSLVGLGVGLFLGLTVTFLSRLGRSPTQLQVDIDPRLIIPQLRHLCTPSKLPPPPKDDYSLVPTSSLQDKLKT